jgi:hypothetical protein
MLSLAEQLALGIGSPKNLDKHTLVDFFQLVAPLETSVAVRDNVRSLRKQAYAYLQRAGEADYARNAKRLLETRTAQDLRTFISEQMKEYEENKKFNDQMLKDFIGFVQNNENLSSCLLNAQPAKTKTFTQKLLIPLGLTTALGLMYATRKKFKKSNRIGVTRDNNPQSVIGARDVPVEVRAPSPIENIPGAETSIVPLQKSITEAEVPLNATSSGTSTLSTDVPGAESKQFTNIKSAASERDPMSGESETAMSTSPAESKQIENPGTITTSLPELNVSPSSSINPTLSTIEKNAASEVIPAVNPGESTATQLALTDFLDQTEHTYDENETKELKNLLLSICPGSNNVLLNRYLIFWLLRNWETRSDLRDVQDCIPLEELQSYKESMQKAMKNIDVAINGFEAKKVVDLVGELPLNRTLGTFVLVEHLAKVPWKWNQWKWNDLSTIVMALIKYIGDSLPWHYHAVEKSGRVLDVLRFLDEIPIESEALRNILGDIVGVDQEMWKYGATLNPMRFQASTMRITDMLNKLNETVTELQNRTPLTADLRNLAELPVHIDLCKNIFAILEAYYTQNSGQADHPTFDGLAQRWQGICHPVVLSWKSFATKQKTGKPK